MAKTDAETAERIAAPAGLLERQRSAGLFVLTTRERITRAAGDLTVYLEGDGFAWASRTRPSTDPTPDDPVGLRLATLDKSSNVAWLARPCQYTPRERNPACNDNRYWTDARFSEEVVGSLNQAIDAIKSDSGAKRVHLVGYSGGGGLAVLLAARRNDVASIRTAAGNLDTGAFTALHGVSPMSGSLNPASAARQVMAIPQRHLVGGQDKVVPKAIAESYFDKLGSRRCARLMVVPDARHDSGWEGAWSADLSRGLPACENGS